MPVLNRGAVFRVVVAMGTSTMLLIGFIVWKLKQRSGKRIPMIHSENEQPDPNIDFHSQRPNTTEPRRRTGDFEPRPTSPPVEPSMPKPRGNSLRSKADAQVPLIRETVFNFRSLSFEDAKSRANDISSIDYKLTISFLKGETYEGIVSVSFKLAPTTSSEIFLDFLPKNEKIHEISINGTNVTSDKKIYLNNRINIPDNIQIKGNQNLVKVFFSNQYSREPGGLHSTFDVKGNQYILSKSGVNQASRIFPCFDQPNLKATLEFSAVSPKEWIVASNQKEVSRLPLDEELFKRLGLNKMPAKSDLRVFAKTTALSSFMFYFLAGSFQQIEQTGGFELKFFSRNSSYLELVKNAKYNEIIDDAVKECDCFFQLPHPWSKLDVGFFEEDFGGKRYGNGGIFLLEREFIESEPTGYNIKAIQIERILRQVIEIYLSFSTVSPHALFS